MNGDVTAMINVLLPVLLASWLSYALGRRQSRAQGVESRRAQTAAELALPLSELRRLVRRHGRVDLDQVEVAAAFRNWFEVFDRVGHRLPSSWRHLSRGVRESVGTVFGPVAFVDVRPDSGDQPLASPDLKWQDFADDYLTYVLSRLARWGDTSKSATEELYQFDFWLARTGRRPVVTR